MPRVSLSRGGVSIVVMCIMSIFPFLVTSAVQLDSPVINVGSALKSRVDSLEEKADIEKLSDKTIEGDLYNHAYDMAKLQVAQPALESLQIVHESIGEFCGGDLEMRDVTIVFGETLQGQEYLSMMEGEDMIDAKIERGTFSVSCKEVLNCYYKELIDAGKINVDKAAYSNTMLSACKTLVSDTFSTVVMRQSALASIQNINYGDEVFSNAKEEDAAYDLLLDVETIGNLMFAHNDGAAEITFYKVESGGGYKDNDPEDVTPYESEIPEKERSSTSRLPPSLGIPINAVRPEEVIEEDPSDGPAKGVDTLDSEPPSMGGGLQPGSSSPASQTIQNNTCVELETDPEEEPLLDLTIEEQEHTVEYNTKLRLDDQVAWELMGKVLPEIEEQYGLGNRSIPDPGVEETVNGIIGDLDLRDTDLTQTREGMKECVAKYADNILDGSNAYGKLVRTTFTQPTKLTTCIKKLLCEQVTDKQTGLGLYRIEFCRIPSQRGYSVVDNKSVYSIEEILDSVNNVCTNLKESGQLIKRNKTKDHLQHQLMEVKIDEMFFFGLTVGFKPLRDEGDPAVQKDLQVAHNRRRMQEQLGVLVDGNQQLSEDERNRYLLLYDPRNAKIQQEMGDPVANEQRAAQYAQDKTPIELGGTDILSQLAHQAKLLDEMDEFTVQNTQFRKVTNDYMHDLNLKRQATYEQFNASK